MSVLALIRLQTTALAEAQNWRCAYCTFRMLRPGCSVAEAMVDLGAKHVRQRRRAIQYRRATRDHIAPRCQGGADDAENLIAACRWCNEYRRNRPAHEAYTRIRRMVRRGTHPHQIWIATGWFPRLDFMQAMPTPPATMEMRP
ncbi:HNH endonuclease [Methylobacterium sp. JK268]